MRKIFAAKEVKFFEPPFDNFGFIDLLHEFSRQFESVSGKAMAEIISKHPQDINY